MRQQTETIQNYILQLCKNPTLQVATKVATHFNISKQAAARHILLLEKKGLIEFSGQRKGKRSSLKTLSQKEWLFTKENLKEDIVWKDHIVLFLKDLPEKSRDLWHYGITEMINNAIDHSEGTEIFIRLKRTALNTTVEINDNGEGIFLRIKRLLNLYDARESILELSKGKLTTDPKHHSGEGIFFTSRAFDHFAILSGQLYFSHNSAEEDWLIDSAESINGTNITLELDNNTERTLKSVMDQFAEADDFTFNKTNVPVKLVSYEGEKLISRSQAKRLVTRFEKFKTILLDFSGVEEIGQGFADEIFRVFHSLHPEIKLIPINETKDVSRMINRILGVQTK